MDIRYSSFFHLQASQLRKEIKRFDEVLSNLQELVMLYPTGFPKIPGQNLYCIETTGFPGAESIVVYYTLEDDGYCTFQYVEKSPNE